MLKPFVVLLLLALASSSFACGDGESAQYIDEIEHQRDSALIDMAVADPSLEYLVRTSDAVGVFSVQGVERTVREVAGNGIPTYYTVYRIKAERWFRGGTAEELLLTQLGGWSEDLERPVLMPGTFLLEPGHTYVLLLSTSEDGRKFGASEYWNNGSVFTAFQVTDGKVHILNHAIADYFSERYNGMDLNNFLAEVEEYVALGNFYDSISQ